MTRPKSPPPVVLSKEMAQELSVNVRRSVDQKAWPDYWSEEISALNSIASGAVVCVHSVDLSYLRDRGAAFNALGQQYNALEARYNKLSQEFDKAKIALEWFAERGLRAQEPNNG